MPSFASERDQTISSAMERWWYAVNEEISTIGNWRQTADDWQWGHPPERLYCDADFVIQQLQIHHPLINPKPIQELRDIVRHWYTDRTDERIPPQSRLLELIEEARGAAQVMQAGIIARFVVGAPTVSATAPQRAGVEGDWLVPTSLANLANRLGNTTTDNARIILKPYGLKPAGNRQKWTVRLDIMPPNLRQKIDAQN